MSKIITSSSNISILESKIVTDLCAGIFYIDLTPSTFIGVGANNALGAKVRITNPYNGQIKNFGSTYDIAAPFTSIFQFNISTSIGGAYEYGEFTIDVQITDADGTTYTVTKTVEPCYPDSQNKSRNYGSLGASIKGICKEAKVYIAVDSLPTYNGVISSGVSQSFTLEYPTGTLATANRTRSYFSDDLFEGVYILSGEICATYNAGDNISYKVKYKVYAKKEVFCQIDECAFSFGLASLYKELYASCKPEREVEIGNQILESVGLYITAKAANDCGEDASEWISRLQGSLGCKCTCDISSAPIVNTTPATDILIEGCNIGESVNGLTRTYTINNYEYIVDVAPNGGFLTVSSPKLSGCSSTQVVTFDIAKVYTQIKTYADSNTTEANFWTSIINKTITGSTPPTGVSQQAWDAMTLVQRLEAILAFILAVQASIPSVPAAYTPPTFENGTVFNSSTNRVALGGSLLRDTSIAGAFKLALTQGLFGIGRSPLMLFDVFAGGNALFSYNGKQALIHDTSFNINIGEKAGNDNTGSGSCINMGFQAGQVTAASYQISLGESSGRTVVGDNGIYIGRNSGMVTDGDNNIMIGNLAGANTDTHNGTLVGFNASAGEPILDFTWNNSLFGLNSDTIGGLVDWITTGNLSVGDRIAVEISQSNIQIGGQALVSGGASFKALVDTTNSFKMLANGIFTNLGSGQTRIRVYRETTNVTVIGSNAHATQSNQVALGDDNVTSLKLGRRAVIGIHDWAIALPRCTTVERNAISTVGMAGGEAVYDATVNKVSVYDKSGSGQWKYLAYEA